MANPVTSLLKYHLQDMQAPINAYNDDAHFECNDRCRQRPNIPDGRVERYPESPYIEPALDPGTGVEGKDVVISSEPNIEARVFMPRITSPEKKLPLVLHYHGGAFYVGSPFNAVTLNF
ncbi:hypothetical protein RJ639_018779 [Escallonia herrerae]|uniref:Alpha/beta hydrolase fold-3 domain-containing protein n=1 Tax=Escallonia herrerae TaxID=1293975 RepID=A0AA88V6P0_9ASTE|nr:hypothetical protein RJ639_018779 [Escallonia herrerae]